MTALRAHCKGRGRPIAGSSGRAEKNLDAFLGQSQLSVARCIAVDRKRLVASSGVDLGRFLSRGLLVWVVNLIRREQRGRGGPVEHLAGGERKSS